MATGASPRTDHLIFFTEGTPNIAKLCFKLMLRISYTLTEATSTKSVVGEHRLDKGIATGRGLPGPDTRALSEVGSLTYWLNAGPAITLAPPRGWGSGCLQSVVHSWKNTMGGRPRGDARKTRHNAVTGVILFDNTCYSFRLSVRQRGCYIKEWVLLLHDPGRAANG